MNRESNGPMWMKMDVDKVTANMICAYAPQMDCDETEKDDH